MKKQVIVLTDIGDNLKHFSDQLSERLKSGFTIIPHTLVITAMPTASMVGSLHSIVVLEREIKD